MKRIVPIIRRNAAAGGRLPPKRQLSYSPALARSKAQRQASRAASAGAPGDVSRPEHPTPSQPSNQAPNAYFYFRALVQKHLNTLLDDFRVWNSRSALHRTYGFDSATELRECTKGFTQAIEQCFNLAMLGRTSRVENPLFWSLRYGFVRGNTSGLITELKYAFRSFAGREKFRGAFSPTTQELVDFRFPFEWYPDTRAMQRTIHLHVGPTNSGKTYNALKALESAKSGIYSGPLRLLAHEVYSRLSAKGKTCALVTGEEQRIPAKADSFLISCTVEMTPLNKRVDVAVIDEIQMLASPDRGWAWTQAFLGVQAKEVHLCGEERTVDIVRALCARTGDKCIVHEYKRLSPLRSSSESIKEDFKNLQKGDAIVAFSRVNLHALKGEVERKTGRRCAIVYGSLPPETRAEQAALFNDPNNDYDFIVASDAIGMGLNLEIKRVIFEEAAKFDGLQRRFLTIPEIKQIGGRAGRFRSAAREMRESLSQSSSSPPEADAESKSKGEDPSSVVADSPSPALSLQTQEPQERSVGLVTTMHDADLERIANAFEVEAEPITSVGIYPPTFVIERVASMFPPETPLTHVILTIREMCTLSDEFFMCHLDDWIEVADAIQSYPMPIADRCTFLAAPINRVGSQALIERLAWCVSEMHGGHLLDLPEINLELLDADPPEISGKHPSEHLSHLERLHSDITLYLWLSYRFCGVFTSQRLAFHVKSLVEESIRERLGKIDHRASTKAKHEKMVRSLLQREKEQRKILGAKSTGASDAREPAVAARQQHEAAGAGNEFSKTTMPPGISVDPSMLPPADASAGQAEAGASR